MSRLLILGLPLTIWKTFSSYSGSACSQPCDDFKWAPGRLWPLMGYPVIFVPLPRTERVMGKWSPIKFIIPLMSLAILAIMSKFKSKKKRDSAELILCGDISASVNANSTNVPSFAVFTEEIYALC